MKLLLLCLAMLLCGCRQGAPIAPLLAGTRAPAPHPNTNSCRAYFAAGWYLLVNENVDSDSDGISDYVVSFRHPSYGMLVGVLNPTRSRYARQNQSAEFWGAGTFRGKWVVIKATVSATGGYYGRGRTRLQCWEDRNGNGSAEAGEPQTFPSGNAMSNQMTLLTFAPKGE
jgi:hypothetical protein